MSKRWILGGLPLVTLLLASAPHASAVPMWSRRYGMDCTACHSAPSLQLTSIGLDFLRRGHRMAADGLDKNALNYLSAHGDWNYTAQSHASNAFEAPEFHVHAGGAFDSHFSAYVDAGVNAELETAYLQFTKEKGDSYFTARAGKISPTIIRDYGNGLMASASTPLILTDATLGANPFTPARDSFGIDAAQRWKALFVQAGVVNGEDVPGQAQVKSKKDFYATAQVNASGQPTGVGLHYHHGGYELGDPAVEAPVPDRYDREGIFANFTRDRLRVAGAFLYGQDRIEGSVNRKIRGYYLQGDVHPASWCAPFVRYDWVKTDEDTGGSATVNQVTLGSSLRLFQTDITAGRAVLEVSRSTAAGEHVNGALLNLLWAF